MSDVLVSLADDGFVPDPPEMAARLHQLTKGRDIKADYYGNGGAVADFEREAAQRLGKERAVMFPTGTLANLMAMRLLAGTGGGRILVHRQSHFFNDSGENLSELGGFTMVPLEGEGAGFSAAAVQGEIDRAADARVATKIGCITIESPSRRLYGARFGQSDLDAVVALAKSHEMPLFLDGARMMIECAYSGKTPAEMAAPFDLVYLSLYKYLGAPFGCVLAGPAEMLDGLFHDRRRFGGSLYQMWPAAVLAKQALSEFDENWRKTRAASEHVIGRIEREGSVLVERIENGTNIVLLSAEGGLPDAAEIKAAGLRNGLKLPPPDKGKLPVKINETWLRLEPDDLARCIVASICAKT